MMTSIFGITLMRTSGSSHGRILSLWIPALTHHYEMDTPGFLKLKIKRETDDMAVNRVEQGRSNDHIEKKRRERNVEYERPKERNRRVEEEDDGAD
jgi:hypothetical protein